VLKGQGAADFPDGGLAAWTVVFGVRDRLHITARFSG
jgi:hypothetical protein